MPLSRQDVLGAGVAAAVLTAIALAVANFIGAGGNGGPAEYAGTLVLSLVVLVALFGWVIPRTEHPARAGVIVGLLAALSVAAFWSGLPYVLGPAAIVLGVQGRALAGNRTTSAIALALGVLASLGGIAAVVLDQTL